MDDSSNGSADGLEVILLILSQLRVFRFSSLSTYHSALPSGTWSTIPPKCRQLNLFFDHLWLLCHHRTPVGKRTFYSIWKENYRATVTDRTARVKRLATFNSIDARGFGDKSFVFENNLIRLCIDFESIRSDQITSDQIKFVLQLQITTKLVLFFTYTN